MENPNPELVALPWFKHEHYYTLKAILTDRKNLPLSYAQWLHGAEAAASILQRDGINCVKVDIDPAMFTRWCSLNAVEPNLHARCSYAKWVLQTHELSFAPGSAKADVFG